MLRLPGWPLLLFGGALSLATPIRLLAQPALSSADAPVRSMGKPPVWKPFTGGYYERS